jgi:hypothetical protein
MRIKAPEGWTNFSMGGQEHYLDADGTIEFPDSTARYLINEHGFTEAPIADELPVDVSADEDHQ